MRKILWLMLFFACYANAAVYMQSNDDEVTYSDTPLSNSQQVVLPSPNTTIGFQTAPANQTTTAANNNTNSIVTLNKYTVFNIVNPKNNETIPNQPVLVVDVLLVPKLQKGDKVQLLLDGKLAGAPVEGTRLQIEGVIRGQHSLYAVVLNAANQVIQQTATITIYVHRANLNYNPAIQPPPKPVIPLNPTPPILPVH